MIRINPQRIRGTWTAGFALDVHTVRSVYLGVDEYGHDVFDTTRTEIRELLYRLKYQGDRAAAQPIIDAAAQFASTSRKGFDVIVPVPPSGVRVVQPVIIIAEGLGRSLGIPVENCVSTTRTPTQLKGVLGVRDRQELLRGLHSIPPGAVKGKHVLLFDDLFRSGVTMNAITDLLLQVGEASSVRALTVTCTRSSQ